MIPLLRAIVPASSATCHAVVRMAPRAVAASIGSGGRALTSAFFRDEQAPACMNQGSVATFHAMPHMTGQWELNALSKYPVSHDLALPWTYYPDSVSLCIGIIRPKSTIAPGARFALRGEDWVDADESEPLDDRDTLSHHTHHKDDTIPMDDRDFDSVHTHHEEDPSVPLDDRDFDSHHTTRPLVVVGTDEQTMRNLGRSNYTVERTVDETEELDDLEYIDDMRPNLIVDPFDEDKNNDGSRSDKTDGAAFGYIRASPYYEDTVA